MINRCGVVIFLAVAGSLGLCCTAFGASSNSIGGRQAVPVIFDTDIGTDVDDAGALAILHVMADLLESGPDSHSPLTGTELVAAKVKELVSMGGRWPNSPKQEGEYNFRMDGPAVHKVISRWPGKIVFTGLGKDVMTGGRLVALAPKDNPVPAFYRNFFEANKVPSRSSWDLIAVLYAVRGLSEYFTLASDGKCVSREDGSNRWIGGEPSKHSYLCYKMPEEELADVIEQLLLAEPAKSRMVSPSAGQNAGAMSYIEVSGDGIGFVRAADGTAFTPWGVNYDHDENGRLLEDYWNDEWSKVREDFQEIKQLGANVVRIHLQFGKFIQEDGKARAPALAKLTDLVKLGEQVGLYLDITGLGCYHKQDVPGWYERLSEKQRWDMQVRFWGAIAKTCASSPAVFCYDLMNEPVLPGNKPEKDWLLGELGGKYFVQRISLDLAGRSRQQVAEAWVDQLTAAIRKQDGKHLITVGVIPWVHVFPKAKPLFYSEQVAKNLDFASVHFYPESDKIDQALTALKAYDIGKPLVIEEMFPLKCSREELVKFILASREHADGWISFYWGREIDEYTKEDGIAGAITKQWLLEFKRLASKIAK